MLVLKHPSEQTEYTKSFLVNERKQMFFSEADTMPQNEKEKIAGSLWIIKVFLMFLFSRFHRILMEG